MCGDQVKLFVALVDLEHDVELEVLVAHARYRPQLSLILFQLFLLLVRPVLDHFLLYASFELSHVRLQLLLEVRFEGHAPTQLVTDLAECVLVAFRLR